VAEAAPEPGAYAGLRVLDLSHVIAGPMCTKLLAEHGADVVKVEPPAGDMTRRFPYTYDEGMTTQFAQYNCGKRSIVIDLASEDGPGLILALAERADVLVENFRPGVLERLGLPIALLRERNPRLVACSISTFGQDGELSAKPGYGFVAEAHSGLMALASDATDPPSAFGTALADMVVAVHAFGAIGAALYRRAQTGRGTHVDVASYETMVSTIDHALVLHAFTGGAQRFEGYSRRHPVIVPNGVVAAADGGHVAYGVTNDTQFAALCALMGEPALAEDPRYATGAARTAARDAVYDRVDAWGATVADAETIARLLEEHSIPAARVRGYDEVAEDPQLVQRGVLQPVEIPGQGPVLIPVAPHHLDGATVGIAGPPPRLGQHTHQVLATDLGLDARAIAELVAAGTVHDSKAAA
jgi:crotonobetainyl-CoA:carnitine CoA-transferase CaiB-like acyl-CoA transferase